MFSVHVLKLEGKSVATASNTNFSFTFNNVLDFWSVAATATGSPGQLLLYLGKRQHVAAGVCASAPYMPGRYSHLVSL